MTQWAQSLDGWWMSDGKREFWMSRDDALAMAREVLHIEQRAVLDALVADSQTIMDGYAPPQVIAGRSAMSRADYEAYCAERRAEQMAAYNLSPKREPNP